MAPERAVHGHAVQQDQDRAVATGVLVLHDARGKLRHACGKLRFGHLEHLLSDGCGRRAPTGPPHATISHPVSPKTTSIL
ncbi:hypothetical protein P8A22_07590 [Streptomyces laculatispora]|uniref:Uncharacterized protein n=1 Tax=Streptomyces laculatispora TaxID=887464 RepID=A0ABY9IFY5_9ACTN|nr:hypothetical protein [Streptomyces laculatispora]WLQ45579.1 hypothetical protein P8A22_07590 [Streptomyces laculatispora]